MPSEPSEASRCTTCYGTGEVVGDSGASVCPDCLGHGRTPRGEVVEWRLRDIERAHAGQASEADVRWLVFELRRHRDALVQVLTRCQDSGESTALASELQHITNDALGLYPVEGS